jgi:hypothetical protein
LVSGKYDLKEFKDSATIVTTSKQCSKVWDQVSAAKAGRR